MPIALEVVGVRVAHASETVLVGEADHATVPRPAERRRVERLDRVRAVARLVGEQPAQHEALGAQRVRHEGMRRDREPALLVDLGDRRAHRAERLDRRLDPQREQVTAERRDLLADHDLERQAAIERHRATGERGIDALVVGDRDHVQLGVALDVVEDLDDAGGAVGRERVDVQVRAPESLGHRPPRAHGVGGRARGRRAAPRLAGLRGQLEVRPERVEDREPLLGRGGDVPLERARLGLEVRGDALATRALGREGHGLRAHVVHVRRRRATRRTRGA